MDSKGWDTLTEVFGSLAQAGFLGFAERNVTSWGRPATSTALRHASLRNGTHGS